MTYKCKEVIGDCVLYLGDCRNIQDLKYNSVVSDPPFGMCFVSGSRRPETKHKAIENDQDVDLLNWVIGLEVDHSKYIFCRWDNLINIPINPKSVITWVKNNHSMGDLKHEHARQTEIIMFYSGNNHYFPCKRPFDVVKAPRTGNDLHPTQKPVELMEVILSWTCGTILDPFMGSGTTLVACAKMGRKGIGIELNEEYFNIACKRVEEAYKQPDIFGY